MQCSASVCRDYNSILRGRAGVKIVVSSPPTLSCSTKSYIQWIESLGGDTSPDLNYGTFLFEARLWLEIYWEISPLYWTLSSHWLNVQLIWLTNVSILHLCTSQARISRFSLLTLVWGILWRLLLADLWFIIIIQFTLGGTRPPSPKGRIFDTGMPMVMVMGTD